MFFDNVKSLFASIVAFFGSVCNELARYNQTVEYANRKNGERIYNSRTLHARINPCACSLGNQLLTRNPDRSHHGANTRRQGSSFMVS